MKYKKVWFYCFLMTLLVSSLLSYSVATAAPPSIGPARPRFAPPIPPSGLTATFVSSTKVNLSWTDNSDNESGFRIYRDGTLLVTVGIGVTSYTDIPSPALKCATAYLYEVEAYNVDGPSARASTVLTTPVCAPTAPTNLITLGVGIVPPAIAIGWTDTSNDPSNQEDGFKIERRQSGTGTWTEIGTVGQNVTVYVDLAVACGTFYDYRVRAYNAGGNSGYSNILVSATASCIPDAPTGLVAATWPIPPVEVDLAWNDVTGETGYKIFRALSPTGTYTEIDSTAANVTFYVDTNVFCGTTYYYKVKATSDYGNSDYSNMATAVWIACLPAAPTDLTATAISDSAIRLKWKDKSNNESGFRIEWSPDGAAWNFIENVDPNTTTYDDTSLLCGTEYYYRIGAYNDALNAAFPPGVWAYSNIAGAITWPCPPPPPTLTVMAVSDTEIDLSWTPSAGAVWYKIERSANGVSNWGLIETVNAPTTTNADINLLCANSYFYRVRAVNASGESDNSNVAGDITFPCQPPVAPSDLTALPISQTQIDLEWTDNSNNESGFKIERSPNGVGGWVLIATVGVDITKYSNKNLTCDSVYYYRVRAYNTYGNSDYTLIASALTGPCGPTPPATPGNFTVTTLSTSQIKLSWSDVSNETGYKVSRSKDNITFAVVATLAADKKTYTDSNLDCGTKYYYFVQAFNTGGSSKPTATKYATTSACGNMAIVKAGKVSANPGAEVTVSVTATNIQSVGLGGSKTEVDFDPGLLQVVTCTADPNSVFNTEACFYDNLAGQVVFDVVSTSGVKPSATLAKIKFKVQAAGTPGTAALLDVQVIDFKSPSGNPLSATDQDGLVLVGKRGDVSGDGSVNVVDALFILQYDVGLKDGTDVFPPPKGYIFLPACDVNQDGKCNVVDAMFLLQCDVGIHNAFCPATAAQAESFELQSGVSSMATIPVNLRVGSGTIPLDGELTLPVTAKVPARGTLGAAKFAVNYDPEVVRVTGCSIEQRQGDIGVCNMDNPGTVNISYTSPTGLIGQPILVSITFVRNNGEPGEYSILKLVPDMLSTAAGDELLVKTSSGKVSLAAPVDAPKVYAIRKAGQQDMELPFAAAEFRKAFRSVNGGQLVKIKILSLPVQGILKLNGVDVIVNQKIAVEDLNQLTYLPGTNWNGWDAFRWSGSNGTSFAPKEANLKIRIHAKNAAPRAYTLSVIGEKDKPLTFAAASFMARFKDPNGDTLVKVMIADLPSHGTLKLDGTELVAGQEIALGELDRLVYEPATGYTGLDQFHWNGSDGMVYAAKDGVVNVVIP